MSRLVERLTEHLGDLAPEVGKVPVGFFVSSKTFNACSDILEGEVRDLPDPLFKTITLYECEHYEGEPIPIFDPIRGYKIYIPSEVGKNA